MAWPLEGMLMPQGDRSASLVSTQDDSPQLLGVEVFRRLSPLGGGPSSFPLFSVLSSLGLGICSDYSRDPHSVLFMPFGC